MVSGYMTDSLSSSIMLLRPPISAKVVDQSIAQQREFSHIPSKVVGISSGATTSIATMASY